MRESNIDHTPDRILDAAEALFAERGFAMTSLRQVTRLANANLAAVSYHFGSKEALLQAVAGRGTALASAIPAWCGVLFSGRHRPDAAGRQL